jgi:hypothetical protein
MLGNLSGRRKVGRSNKWSSELILRSCFGWAEEEQTLAAAEVTMAREVDFCRGGSGEKGAGGFNFVPTDGGGFIFTQQARQLLLEPVEELSSLEGEGKKVQFLDGQFGWPGWEEGIHPVVFLAEDLGQAKQRSRDLASERFFDGGNDSMAEAVADGIEGGIRGVLAPGLIVLPEVGAQFFARPIEQGTPDFQFAALMSPGGFLTHAAKAAASAATEKIMQNGLDLVVGVMSQEQNRGSLSSSTVGEKIVPGEASGSFK